VRSLTIGRAAKLAELGVETLRFYERQGLIAPPPRTASGYRQYPQEVVARLRFIQRAKALGFTLGEIKELLSLRFSPSADRCDIKARAEAKLAAIEAKLQDLKRMKGALEGLTQACAETASARGCPILEALEDSGGSDPPEARV
jgi:Hg(II)-responsive transcriptional regulator